MSATTRLRVVEQGPALDGELHGVQARDSSRSSITSSAGPKRCDLAAQLGADRAAGAGDEHPAAGEVVGDAGDVGVDLAAAEQVGGGEGPDVAEADAVVEQVASPAARPCTRRPASLAELGQLADEGAVGGRDGDEQHLGVRVARRPRRCRPGCRAPARRGCGGCALRGSSSTMATGR